MNELTFDDIKPYLSERGVLEVELASQRALVARLLGALEAATSGTTGPSE